MEQLAVTDVSSVVVLNKIDVAAATPLPGVVERLGLPVVKVSALTHAGVETLMQAVLAQLGLDAIDPTEPFAFTTRQREALLAAAESPTAETALSGLCTLQS